MASQINKYIATAVLGTELPALSRSMLPDRTTVFFFVESSRRDDLEGKYQFRLEMTLFAYTAEDCHVQAMIYLENINCDYKVLSVEPTLS